MGLNWKETDYGMESVGSLVVRKTKVSMIFMVAPCNGSFVWTAVTIGKPCEGWIPCETIDQAKNCCEELWEITLNAGNAMIEALAKLKGG